MWVVPSLEPFEDRHAGLGVGFEATTVQYFALERGEEPLGHGVIVSTADQPIEGITAISWQRLPNA